MIKLYQYPNCSTCKKAIKFLRSHSVSFSDINIADQAPSKAELLTMLAAYDGNIRKLFNTSGMRYRELGMKDKIPTASNEELLDLLAGDGMLVKRPFLLTDGLSVVGFKEEQWQQLVK